MRRTISTAALGVVAAFASGAGPSGAIAAAAEGPGLFRPTGSPGWPPGPPGAETEPCPPDTADAAAALATDLRPLWSCQEIDVEALVPRLRDTPHLGLFSKLALKRAAEQLLQEAVAYDAAPTAEGLTRLRARFDALFADVLGELGGRDPALAADLTCAHAWGFPLLLDRAAAENRGRIAPR